MPKLICEIKHEPFPANNLQTFTVSGIASNNSISLVNP